MLLRLEDLSLSESRYTPRPMDWPLVRSAFIRERTRLKLNQTQVAQRGDLADQSAVSKLENNDKLGPTVGVFLGAIKGLGLTPLEFFSRVDDFTQTPKNSVTTPLRVSSTSDKTTLSRRTSTPGGERGASSSVSVNDADGIKRDIYLDLAHEFFKLSGDRGSESAPADRARESRRRRKAR